MSIERPDTTIGPNCGYEALRGLSLFISATMYEYVTNCAYGVCKADCCAHGCWVSESRKQRIIEHWDGIKEFLEDNVGKNVEDHIHDFPAANDPGSSIYDPIYKGMLVHGSNMVRGAATKDEDGSPRWNAGMCSMLTRKHDGIEGCAIHKYAHLSGNADWHEIKPLGCILFPARAYIAKDGRVGLTRRNWKDAPCCQKVTKPGDGPRAIDVQLKSISSLFDIPMDRLQAIIEWFEPSSARELRLQYEARLKSESSAVALPTIVGA